MTNQEFKRLFAYSSAAHKARKSGMFNRKAPSRHTAKGRQDGFIENSKGNGRYMSIRGIAKI